jgi:hypothetical protein
MPTSLAIATKIGFTRYRLQTIIEQVATEVIITNGFESWFNSLTIPEQDAIVRIVTLLEDHGIALTSPYTSAIKGSKLPLRELRVQHMGEPHRILYIFDPARRAVLLVGGNKVGIGNHWYRPAIRQAEKLYALYLAEIESEEELHKKQSP